MSQQPSSSESAQSSDRPSPTAPERPTRHEGQHPSDAAHDLSDSDAHARSPEEYTEEPGSHRRDADGPALDVGG